MHTAHRRGIAYGKGGIFMVDSLWFVLALVLLAVVSVALGMAVMILAMAVIMGFKREVARKMTGFAAHVAVTDIRGVNALYAQPVRRSAHV